MLINSDTSAVQSHSAVSVCVCVVYCVNYQRSMAYLSLTFKSTFERKPKQMPPLSIRVSCDLKDVGFQKINVLSSNIVSTPPWLLMRPIVNYSLHGTDKADIPAEIHKHRFY